MLFLDRFGGSILNLKRFCYKAIDDINNGINEFFLQVPGKDGENVARDRFITPIVTHRNTQYGIIEPLESGKNQRIIYFTILL